jgi:hypothetical protein
MILPQDRALPTVGDTIWVTRTVELPAGQTLRAADWQAADPLELLGPAKVTVADGRAAIAYPVAVWRPGTHTVEVPGPLLLGADGRVDSIPGERVTLSVGSVLPRAAADTALRPQPRADFVSRPSTTPIPLVVLLLLAALLLLPLHRWWRRRGAPARRPPVAGAGVGPRPELDRWADAGEARAVAAVASTRLRLALSARLPGALSSLDTESVLLHVAAQRPDWPVAELAEVLRSLDRARFGAGAPPDVLVLARRAGELEPRLVPEAA